MLARFFSIVYTIGGTFAYINGDANEMHAIRFRANIVQKQRRRFSENSE